MGLFSAKVERRGRGESKKLIRFVQQLSEVEVQVGFFDAENTRKAAANEYGVVDENVPERSFMRPVFKQAQGRAMRRFAGTLSRSLANPKAAMLVVGDVVREQIQQNIEDWPADNAPATVRKKGFNKGLIETGDMHNAVQVRARKR